MPRSRILPSRVRSHRSRARRFILSAAVATLCVPVVGSGATLFWDADGSGPNPLGGTGLWNLTLSNWATDTLGTSYVVWPNQLDSIADFQGTPGTVHLAATGLQANGLIFEVGGFTLDNTGLPANNLTIAGASPGIAVNAGLATISANLQALFGFSKTGAGTLTLSGSNTISGPVVIGGGTLRAGSTGALGGTAVSFADGSNASLVLNGQNVTVGGLDGDSTAIVENASAFSAALTIAKPGELTAPLGVSIFNGLLRDGAGGGQLSVVKRGLGAEIFTNTANSYSGTTVVADGSLVVSDARALGTSNSTVGVVGIGGLGFTGGQLVVQGGLTGIDFNRNLSIAGRGPGAANNVSSALLLVGHGTNLSGNLSFGTSVDSRLAAAYGNTTLSGLVTLEVGQFSGFQGNGNLFITGQITGGENVQDRFGKIGTGIASTLVLSNPNNNFLSPVRIDSGFVRVATNAALGLNTSTIALDLNNGTLEVRTDAPDFSSRKVRSRDFATGNIFVDRAIGGTGLNQTVAFGDLLITANGNTFNVTGRDGYNTSLVGTGGSAGSIGVAAAGNLTIVNGSNGTLTLDAASLSNNTDATGAHIFTLRGSGDTIATGSLKGTNALNTFVKDNQGSVTIQGTAGTLEGNSTLTAGTLNVLGQGSLGGSLNTRVILNGGTLVHLGTAELWANRTIGLNTASNLLLANQTAGTWVIPNNLSVSSTAAKNLVLGGSSTAANEISGVIGNNQGVTSVVKIGPGTWQIDGPTTTTLGPTVTGAAGTAASGTAVVTVGNTAGYQVGQAITGTGIPANSIILQVNSATQFTISQNATGAVTSYSLGQVVPFTGNVSVANGLLRLAATSSGGDALNNTSGITFAADTLTGSGTAGGVFEYAGTGSTATLEDVGPLGATAGAGTVRVAAGSGGATLRFSGLTAPSAGTGINLVPGTGGTITLAGVANANGMVNPHVYFNGADFASSTAGVTGAAAYTDAGAGPLAASNPQPYQITASFTQPASVTVLGGLKFGGQTLTLDSGVTLTVNNGSGTAGGLLVSGGNSATITGGTGLTTGGAGDLVVRTDAAADTLTIASPLTSGTTGGLTKNGAGTLVLSAVNAQTGTTTINEGTLRLSGAGTLSAANQALTLRQGGTLDLNGLNTGTAVGAFNGAGLVTNGGAAATFTIGNGNGASLFSGVLQDGAGRLSLTKAGTGGATLIGLNTYTGVTTISGGSISTNVLANIGTASGIGRGDSSTDATNAASLVFNGGTLQYTGSNTLFQQATQSSSISINRLFTLAGTANIDLVPAFGNNVLGTLANNNAAVIFNNPANVAFSGTGARALQLSGNSTGDNEIRLHLVDNPNGGALSLTRNTGNGLWILNPATANTYSGATTIVNGVLQAVDGFGVPTGSNLVFNNATGGVFQTNAFARTLGTGSGNVQWTTNASGGFAAASAKLTVNLGAQTWGNAGTGFLGTGALILSSNSALSEVEYASGIDLNGGTAAALTLGTTSGSANVTGPTAGLVLGQVVTGSGIPVGATILNITGPNAFTLSANATATNASAAVNLSSIASGASVNFQAGTTSASNSVTGPTAGLVVGQPLTGATGIPAGSVITGITDANTFTISANATVTGTTYAAALPTAGRVIQVDDNGTTTTDFATVSGVLSGTGGLTKTGSGTLLLGGANTYAGATQINAGNVFAQSIGADGATSTSFGTNVNGGTLNLGTGGTGVFLGYVGTGETTTRPVALASTTGGITIDASGSGALILTNLANVGLGAKTLTLRGQNTDSNEIRSSLSDAAPGSALSVTKTEGGVWILTGNNSFTGNLTTQNGLLGLNDGAAAGSPGTGLIAFDNGGLFGTAPLTLFRALQINSNRTGLFAGQYGITVNGTVALPAGGNWAINNTIAQPGALTFNGAFTNLDTGATSRVLSINGTGDTVFNTAIPNPSSGAGTALSFGSSGSLLLNAASGFSGGATESQGYLILNNSAALGTGAFTMNGGTLIPAQAFTSTTRLPNALTLNGNLFVVAPVTAAQALSSGLVAGSYDLELGGLLTVSGNRSFQNSLDPAKTLTFSGGVTNSAAGTLTFLGGGTTVINSVIFAGTGTAAVTYSGSGKLNLTADNLFAGAFTVNGGTTTLSGNGRVGAAASITVNQGGTLTLDNTSTNPAAANRLGNKALTLAGSTLNFIGLNGTAGSTEGTAGSAGTLLLTSGANVIKATNNGGTTTLNFASLTQTAAGATVDFQGGVGSATNKVIFATSPTLVPAAGGLLPKATVAGADFATYGANGIAAFAGYTSPANVNSAAATDTVKITSAVTTTSLTVAKTLNALAYSGTGLNLTTAGDFALTLTSGGVLVASGANTLGAARVVLGAEGAFHIADNASLNVTGGVTGTAGLTKTLGGTLTLSGRDFYSGTTTVNGGTLTLAGGDNTLLPAQPLTLNALGTLNLNNNVQYVAAFSSGSSLVPGTGGTVTGGGGLLATNFASANGVFAGSITGGAGFAFVRSGGNTLTVESPLAYSGATWLVGGTTTLRDDAALPNTSALNLHYGTLTLDNNASLGTSLTDRVNDAAPLTLRGGTITYQGRALTAASETLGALSLAEGGSVITNTTGNSGSYFSSEVTFASLARTSGSTVNFTTNANVLGQAGNNPRTFFTRPLNLTAAGALPAWAIVNTTDYAGYNAATGVGAIGAGGFAAYDVTFGSNKITNLLALANQTTPLAANTTTGMLRLAGAFANDLTFAASGTVLNLEQGGLLQNNAFGEVTIGTAASRGVLTAGGTASSGTSELIAYNTASTVNFTGIATNSTTLNSNVVSLTSVTGLQPGMLVTNANLPAGTFITAVDPVGLTVTVSNPATAAGNAGIFVGTAAMTINSVIANTSTATGTGSGTVSLVKSGSGILNLTAANSYTGGTTVNQGSVNLLGAAGTVAIPGTSLTLSGATVTMLNNPGQIAAANAVILNGSSTLTLLGANSLTSLSYNNDGGTGTPTVTTGGLLTLTGTNAISAASSNPSTTAVLNGTVDLGSGSKTFNVEAIAVGGRTITSLQPTLTIGAVLTGTGATITKSGTGLLQFGSAANTFSDNLAVTGGGIIVAGGNSNPTQGGVPLINGPLGTGSVNFSSGTSLLIDGSSRTIGNDLTFQGNPIFDTTGTATVTLTLNGRLSLTGGNMGVSIGSPNLTVALLGRVSSATPITQLTKSGLGNLQFGLDAFGAVPIVFAGTGALSLLADGDGLGGVQTIAAGDLTFDPGVAPSITVGRVGTTVPFTVAANKIIAPSSISSIATGLTVTNNNGYGLLVSDAVTLVGTPTFSVSTATASNVTQGLRLAGLIVGTGFTKAGAGTAELTNSGNSFTGVIAVNAGVLAAASDGALGNAANAISLAPTTGNTATFRATSNFSTAHVIKLANTTDTRAIEVTAGNTLTVNSPFDVTGAAAASLAKNDAGTLALAVANPGWSGALSINQGAVQLSTNGGAGTGTISVAPNSSAVGAALQLANGVTVNNPLNLQGNNNQALGGLDFGGQLESVSGTNMYTGLITQAFDSAIGVDAGSVLNINGGIASSVRQLWLNVAGGGSLNLNSAITTLYGLQKYGNGLVNVTAANTSAWVGLTPATVAIHQGTFTLSGLGTITNASAGFQVDGTGTLTLDNSVTNVANRLGGKALLLNGGAFNFIGSTTANSTEVLGAPTFGRGYTEVTVTAGTGQQANLQFSAASNNVAPTQGTGAAGSSIYFRGTNLGSAVGAGVATIVSTTGGIAFSGSAGASGLTKALYPWAILDPATAATQGANTQFATADTVTSVLRQLNPVTEMTSVIAANNNVRLTAAGTVAATVAPNSLTLESGGGLTISPLIPLNLASGGILAKVGNTGISGGVISQASTLPPLSLWTIGDLEIASTLHGGNGAGNGNIGIVKAGVGTLTISSPASLVPGLGAYGGNTYSGQLVINQGTVKLNGGIDTIMPNNFLALDGGKLELNGNSQFVLGLFTDAFVANGGGTVTNSAAGQAAFVLNQDNAARNFAGAFTGNLFLARSGQNTLTLYSPETYSGGTLINGGTTTLRDSAALSGTSAIEIAFATLSADNNTSTLNLTDRIRDAAAITLRGGTLTIQGRAQTASTETLGLIIASQGFDVLNPLVGGTGVNSIDVTVAGLSRPAGSSATLIVQGTNLGTIGSNSRVLAATTPVLTNNLVGPWAINGNDFLTYIPNLGFAAMSQTGAAGYDFTNLFPAGNTALLAAKNVRISTAGTYTVPAGGTTVNALSFAGASSNTIFTNATDVLNLTSGGFIGTNNNNTFGATVDSGRLTAGGLTPAASTDLYVYNRGNTLTLNSRLIDNPNGSGSAVRAVFTASGGAITLPNVNNSYTGGTVLNGGTLNLSAPSAGTVIPLAADPGQGLVIVGGTVNMNGLSGQIDAGNVITLVGGGSTINFFGNNTIAGLVLDDAGGSSSNVTVNSFIVPTTALAATPIAGSLGVLTIGSQGIVASSQNVASTNILLGRFDFGASPNTVTVNPLLVNGVNIAPFSASLDLRGVVGSAGGITKNGLGVLQFSAPSIFTGPFTVAEGSIQIGTTLGGSRFSAFTLNAGTRLNLNGNSTTLGSLSGSGTVFNQINNAATLTVGFDNTDTAFSGQISRFNDAVLNSVSLQKIGTGTLTMASAQSAATGVTGTTTINGGRLLYSGSGANYTSTPLQAASFTVNTSGTLELANTGSALNNRLGLASAGTLTLQGGQFIVGGAAAGVSETVNTLTLSNGAGTVTLLPAGGGAPSLTINNLSGQGSTAAAVFRGLGTANLTITAPSLVSGQGTGGNGSKTMAVRSDILGDASPTGRGTGFLVKDSVTGFYRALAAGELNPDVTTWASTQNGGLTGTQTISINTTANTITASGTGTALNTGINTTAFGLFGQTGLFTQFLSGATGVLVTDGDTTFNVGAVASTSTGTTQTYQVLGGASLTINGYLSPGGTSGLIKAGDGSLTLNQRALYIGNTSVVGGTLNLNSGQDNTLAVVPGTTVPALTALSVQGPATGSSGPAALVDLNNRSQAVGVLQSVNPLPGTGGTVTNSGASLVTLTSSGGGTFSGQITGNLAFTRTGNNTTLLTSANSYTGATIVRGGILQLRDSGTIASTDLQLQFGTLNVDQSNLNPLANLNPIRVPVNSTVLSNGGTLSLTGGGAVDSTLTVASYNTAGGLSTINVLPTVNQGGTATITIGNLIHETSTAAGATAARVASVNVNGFTSNTSTLGGQGLAANGRVFLTQLNGTPFTSANLVNGLIGGWITASADTFATYRDGIGIGPMGGTVQGVVFPGFDGTDVSAATTATQNINDGTSPRTLTAGDHLANSWRMAPAASQTITLASGARVLLGVGFITNANQTITIAGTDATSTLSSPNPDLYAYVNQGTTVISARITGAINLIKNGGGNLQLTPVAANNYTGTTYLQGGGLLLNAAAGIVAVPGDLVINNSTLTYSNTNAGQIASTSNVTLNGGAVFNLPNYGSASTNTYASLTFNNPGSSANTQLNFNTPAALSTVTLTGANAITATNDNFSQSPLITSSATSLSALQFTNAAPVITTSGLSPNSLQINVPITSAGGTITKAGAGSLTLSQANTFTTGLNLAEGSLIFGIATTGTLPAVTNGPVGTGTLTLADGTTVLSDTTTRIVGNPVTVNGSFTFGGVTASNNVTFSNTVSLGASNRTLTVASPSVTATITGALTSTATDTALTKAGPGVLLLSSGSNNFSGPGVAVTGGILRNGIDNALPIGTQLTTSPGGGFDLNNFLQTFAGINGGGFITNSGGSAKTLIVGGLNATDTTSALSSSFSGSIANAAGALTLTKAGAGTLTLSGNSSYSGVTNVNSGRVVIGAATALGAATANTIVANNASLQLQSTAGFSSAEPISLLGSGSDGNGVLRNLSGNNTVSGNVTMTGASTFGSDADTLTLSGVVSGAFALNKVGAGTILLSNAANTYTGVTTVSAGILAVSGAAGLGTTAGNTVVQSGGSLELRNVIIAEALNLNGTGTGGNGALRNLSDAAGGSTVTGAITLAGDASLVSDSGTLNLTGGLTAASAGTGLTVGGAGDTSIGTAVGANLASLTKQGAGRLFLDGNNAALDGTVTVSAGTLSIGNTGALGSSVNGTTVQSGGTLELRNGITITEALTLAGSGAAGSGALRSATGANTVSSTINLVADAALEAAAGSSLTLSNAASVAGTGNLTVQGAGNAAIQGTVGIGAGQVIKNGAGTLQVAVAQAYTGQTAVNQGTLDLRGSLSGDLRVAAGALLDVSTFGSGYRAAAGTTITANGTVTGSLIAPNGARLAGAGTVSGSLTAEAGGEIAPGDGVGLLTAGSGLLQGGAKLTFELGGVNNSDRLLLTGAPVNLNSDSNAGGGALLQLALVNGYAPSGSGDLIGLIDNPGNGLVLGTFRNTTPGQTFPSPFGGTYDTVSVGNQIFAVTYTGNISGNTVSFSGGNDVVLMAVPEPGAASSLLTALGLLTGLQRFRRRRA